MTTVGLRLFWWDLKRRGDLVLLRFAKMLPGRLRHWVVIDAWAEASASEALREVEVHTITVDQMLRVLGDG